MAGEHRTASVEHPGTGADPRRRRAPEATRNRRGSADEGAGTSLRVGGFESPEKPFATVDDDWIRDQLPRAMHSLTEIHDRTSSTRVARAEGGAQWTEDARVVDRDIPEDAPPAATPGR